MIAQLRDGSPFEKARCPTARRTPSGFTRPKVVWLVRASSTLSYSPYATHKPENDRGVRQVAKWLWYVRFQAGFLITIIVDRIAFDRQCNQ